MAILLNSMRSRIGSRVVDQQRGVVGRLAKLVRLTSAIAILVLLSAEQAHGCPFCRSSTGGQVRAAIFDSEFGYHLAGVLAPFSILIAILLLVSYMPLPHAWPLHQNSDA